MPNDRWSRYPEIPGLTNEQRSLLGQGSLQIQPGQAELFTQRGFLEDSSPGTLTVQTGGPSPLLSNNTPVVTFVLYKELTGYPNYGNPSSNADILYTGNRGAWTFDNPAFLFVPGNMRATLGISMILDDHSNVPTDRYSARITINGSVVHNGRLSLPHGSPAGGMFTNWRELTFNVPNIRRNNRIVIENTSRGDPDNWIGIDWMELRLLPR